jgi:hypothetical protein
VQVESWIVQHISSHHNHRFVDDPFANAVTWRCSSSSRGRASTLGSGEHGVLPSAGLGSWADISVDESQLVPTSQKMLLLFVFHPSWIPKIWSTSPAMRRRLRSLRALARRRPATRGQTSTKRMEYITRYVAVLVRTISDNSQMNFQLFMSLAAMSFLWVGRQVYHI